MGDWFNLLNKLAGHRPKFAFDDDQRGQHYGQ
jgi:hypothetical protein